METCIFRVKKFFLFLIVVLLCFTSCGSVEEKKLSETEPSNLNSLTFDEAENSVYSSDESENTPNNSITTNTGSVIELPYNNLCGNAVWDMKIYESCLYIGAGNYDRNYTVNLAYRYNLSSCQWEKCGLIPDEQIDCFSIINNSLVIPGIDPTGEWTFGNYYILENGEFETRREIPGGIHCFDIAEYKGKTFFGLGVLCNSYPVMYWDSENEEYIQVAVRDKNGELVDMSLYEDKFIRAYNFFALNNSFYALIELDKDISIYKYENGEFLYHSNYSKKISRNILGLMPLLENVVWNNRIYFTNGFLYQTEDMKTIRDETPENVDLVNDLLVYNERMFLLGCTENSDGTYSAIIMENKNGEYITLSEFVSDYIPMSMEYDGIKFYVATGDREAESRIDNYIKIIPFSE